MFLKKNEEFTVEKIMELGFPPIFSQMIFNRLEELKQRGMSLKAFKPEDFCTLVKFKTDQEKIAKTLNSAFKV